MTKSFVCFYCLILPFFSFAGIADTLVSGNWDNPGDWTRLNDSDCTISLASFNGQNGNGLKIDYALKPASGWVNMSKAVTFDLSKNPVTFLIKTNASSDLEMKFIDRDDSVFGKKVSLQNKYRDWERVVVYLNNSEYWWGGNTSFEELASFDLAISGVGSGTVWIDEIGAGLASLQPSFPPAGPVWDADSTLVGYGFRQRRNAEMAPEDPLVLDYLKVIQDVSSQDKQLLPSMEGDEAQTFNNSLVAIAFIIKDEKERAERILDFYASATNENNSDPTLQNFFLNGESRGFYQRVSLTTYHDESGTSDRWMGDMAWLFAAYKYYEKKYNSNRYDNIISLIKNLLISFYVADGDGGYVQHGWRNGDTKLHEGFGHHEGNIDCYAIFKLCGEDGYAQNIKKWLDKELTGANYPLDLYTWRVLAFGKGYEKLLNIPEYDFRYRKILSINNADVMGFYHGPDITINNIWVDGVGHIACAYLLYGERERGYFYANQLDKYIIERTIAQQETHSLPYTINKTGGYDWVDTNKGFISCAAWYIIAKNRFNPLRIETVSSLKAEDSKQPAFNLYQNYPNPFNQKTIIKYNLDTQSFVNLGIYDVQGNLIHTLINEEQISGEHTIKWDGQSSEGRSLASGIYFYRIISGSSQETIKALLLK